MPAGTMTARRAVLRWRVMPAVLISLAAGLGLVVPAPHAAADAAPMTALSGTSSAGPAESRPPPTSSTSARHGDPDRDRHQYPRPPIPVGADPDAIAITPDGRTAYVVNGGLGHGDPDRDRHQHRRRADTGRG